MFSLHESTRLRLCRTAFLALCVAPTCAVLAWSVAVHLPWYRRAHEHAITRHLGWQAKLAHASNPRPGTLLYQSLELADPHNGQLLARLPLVEVEASSAEIVVRLPYPAIVNGTRLDAFWRLLQDLARTTGGTADVRFEASNLTLHLGDGDQTFTDVAGRIHGDGRQARSVLSFRRAVAGTQSAGPCEIVCTRRADDESPAHTIEFSTGTTPLPATLLTSIWPAAAQLGKRCHFVGSVSASDRSGVWRTDLAGRLTGIDLDVLVSRQFPHKLSGPAEARFKRVALHDGRVEFATGSLTAGPGIISRSLVQSAETNLHVQATADAIRGPGNVIDYKQLSLGFEIGSDGLALRGEVPRTRGALLVDARWRALAVEPPVISQPVVDLVRTLVPHSEVQVPATRETIGLTRALPVPAIVPPPGREQPLPHARALNVTPRPAVGKTIRR